MIFFARGEKKAMHHQLAHTRHGKCRDPGSNRGPSDLQSDALLTELSRLCFKFEAQSITKPNNAKWVCFIGKQWCCHYGAAAASLLAHVSAITPGTRDICLPFFMRRIFADQSSPLNTDSAGEHAKIPNLAPACFFRQSGNWPKMQMAPWPNG